jgi:hypothetical protein
MSTPSISELCGVILQIMFFRQPAPSPGKVIYEVFQSCRHAVLEGGEALTQIPPELSYDRIVYAQPGQGTPPVRISFCLQSIYLTFANIGYPSQFPATISCIISTAKPTLLSSSVSSYSSYSTPRNMRISSRKELLGCHLHGPKRTRRALGVLFCLPDESLEPRLSSQQRHLLPLIATSSLISASTLALHLPNLPTLHHRPLAPIPQLSSEPTPFLRPRSRNVSLPTFVTVLPTN